jgi:hypothetical protein
VWFALTDAGIDWPDEIYQSLEPAHRLVFGYGLIPWEYSQGVRSWALPGVVAGILKAAVLTGFDAPFEYLRVVRLVLASIGVATAWASYRVARIEGADSLPAAAGAAFFALAAPAVYLSPRAFSETISTLPVVLGLSLLLQRNGSARQTSLGASLLGLSVLLRLHNALFCVAALFIVAARRDRTRTVQTALVFFAWMLILGLLDRLTWGQWFQSAIRFIDFNLIQGRASEWGVMPAVYYVRVMWRSLGVLAVAAAVLGVIAARRAPALFATTVAILVIYTLVPHKEFRFILALLPLIGALAGIGLHEVIHATGTVRTRAVVVVLWIAVLVWSGGRSIEAMKSGELLRDAPEAERGEGYLRSGSVNRLLLAASGEPSICGIHVEVSHWAWTGGYTYLHRRVPLYDEAPAAPEHFNYVIARLDGAPAGVIRGVDGPFVLLNVRDACTPDRSFVWLR